MKKSRGVVRGLLLFFFLICLSTVPVLADRVKLKENSTVKLQVGESTKITVKTTRKLVPLISYDILATGKCSSGGVRIRLAAKSGRKISNDLESMKNRKSYNSFCYGDNIFEPAGTYIYTISNQTDHLVRIKYTIFGFDKIASAIQFEKDPNVNTNAWNQIGKISAKCFSIPKKVVIADESIIDGCGVTYDGKFYVHGKKKGTTKIAITFHNGKTVQRTVRVNPLNPNFHAYVTAYRTRENYFMVKYQNHGAKTVYINSGIKVENYDYKEYDRSVYLKQAVSVGPHKSVSVKYYVKGGYTYPDYSDFRLFYYFTYDGIKYKGRVNDCGSGYYKNNKEGWLTTYWVYG